MARKYIIEKHGKKYLVDDDGMFTTETKLDDDFDSSSHTGFTKEDDVEIDDELALIDKRRGTSQGVKGYWKKNWKDELIFTPDENEEDETEDDGGYDRSDEVARVTRREIAYYIRQYGKPFDEEKLERKLKQEIEIYIDVNYGDNGFKQSPDHYREYIKDFLAEFRKKETDSIGTVVADGILKFVVPLAFYGMIGLGVAGISFLTHSKKNNQIKPGQSIESVIDSPNVIHYKRDANGSLALTNPKSTKKEPGKNQIYYRIGTDGSLILTNVPNKKPEKKEIIYYAYTDIRGKTYLLDKPYIDRDGMASIRVPDPNYGSQTFSIGKEAVERKLDDNKLYCWEEKIGYGKFIRLEKQPEEGLEAKLFNGRKESCKN